MDSVSLYQPLPISIVLSHHSHPTAATSRGHNSPPQQHQSPTLHVGITVPPQQHHVGPNWTDSLPWGLITSLYSYIFRNSALTSMKLTQLTNISLSSYLYIFTNSLKLYETSFLNSLALTEHSSHSGNIFTIL